jgi:hypothetical protein
MAASTFPNVKYVGSVYGSNGSPTAAAQYEASVAMGGFERRVTINLAPATFERQAELDGWSEHEIKLWVRKAIHKYVVDQASIDGISDSLPVTMPSDKLFEGYKPKG